MFVWGTGAQILDICRLCISVKVSSPKCKASIVNSRRKTSLNFNSSLSSLQIQRSRIKWTAASNTQPQIQPWPLAKLTRNRSAFKLLYLCLILVWIVFKILHPTVVSIYRGENVRHNVGCRTRNLDAIFVARTKCFTCSISYCKDNIKCDSASNAPKCPLNNDVSIVQKHVVKLSNTSTMFSQQVKIT